MKKPKSKRWDVARNMPPLRHSFPDQAFDWMDSEVCRWLVHRPEIRKLVFDAVRDRGCIVFDPESGTWRGVDYGD